MDPTYPEFAAILGALLIGGVGMMVATRLFGRSLLRGAKRDALQTISEAEKEAAFLLKEASTSIKEKEIDLRQRVEEDSQRQRKDLLSLERRILAKEESVEKRFDVLENKTTGLVDREAALAERDRSLREDQDKVKEIISQQLKSLESISGLSADAARKIIIEKLEQEVRRDTAHRLKRIEDEMLATVEKKARRVLAEAVQRTAADHVAEHSISVVAPIGTKLYCGGPPSIHMVNLARSRD